MSRRKRPSKRRVLARLRIGRKVPMDDLTRHDLDSFETKDRFNLTLDFAQEIAFRTPSPYRVHACEALSLSQSG